MGWHIHLNDNRGHDEGWWNYTHNCNGMAYTAAEEAGVVFPPDTQPCWALPKTDDGKLTHYPNGRGTVSWWEYLNGMSGPEGAAFLDVIIKGLEAEPDRFRAVNPSNGWGDYDSFLQVLISMRNAVPELAHDLEGKRLTRRSGKLS